MHTPMPPLPSPHLENGACVHYIDDTYLTIGGSGDGGAGMGACPAASMSSVAVVKDDTLLAAHQSSTTWNPSSFAMRLLNTRTLTKVEDTFLFPLRGTRLGEKPRS